MDKHTVTIPTVDQAKLLPVSFTCMDLKCAVLSRKKPDQTKLRNVGVCLYDQLGKTKLQGQQIDQGLPGTGVGGGLDC